MMCVGCDQYVMLKGVDPEERLDAYVVHAANCAGLEGPWSLADGKIIARGSDRELTVDELEPLIGPEVVLERDLEEIKDAFIAAGLKAKILEDKDLVEVAVMNNRDRYLVDKRGGITLKDSQGAVVDDELNVDIVKNAMGHLFRY